MDTCFLAVDGGGTFLKAALFSGMEMLEDTFFKIPACSGGSLEEIRGAFRSLGQRAAQEARASGRTVSAAAVGMPGPFGYKGGILNMTHKFTAARGWSVRPWIQEGLGDVPVAFGHDSTLFFRGGAYLEDLSGCRDICGVTLGTGLGFAAVKDGKLLVDEDGGPGISLWGRPYRGSIAEDYVSRRAVIREYEAASGRKGLDVYDISLLARAGDPAALGAFAALGRDLGAVAGETIRENAFEVLLLGGAISKSADLFLPALQESLRRLDRPPRIRTVKDIDRAPLYGAAALCAEGLG
ncbi:ROK family protein [uncultured Oscillibacter sp.]|uniref:ROK family protein n=1 Tax=uncultured Oscillibacter sp. TaxID=876091 RepID=UPI0025E009AC|nr:ROK family protein [uncultured Oscillibacter sp.]